MGCASVLTGPKALSGFLGRSLSVMCQYDAGYLDYHKYWCKGTFWSDCHIVVETRGSEAEVKAGRTSIKDNQTRLEFTVSLKNLTQQDAGGYWCGIRKAGVDPGFSVDITVLLEPPTTTIAITTGYFSTVPNSSTLRPTRIPPFVTTILLPVVFLVLVILLVAALLLMWRLKKQKAAKASGDIPLSMAPNQTEGNISSTTVKPKQRSHNKTAPPSPPATNNTEVEYASMIEAPTFTQSQVPTTTEDISYASLNFTALHEEATYANVQ
ncbi:CMRF35-like molecule 1 isoform X2 [Rhineura floridana]|uniref:CMRF35-like molecule 1 isoform X2 n=1 Tax=Rhineura floridana TaxID=261503 RepID=UPI002AC884FD|nr:CMRF35-like molecule 1 isoform X2 [Rhineura floridana]